MEGKVVNIKTLEGFENPLSPTGHKPVRTSEKYEQMIEHEDFKKMPPPSLSQKQMRELSDLWDKAYIHFEKDALPQLQEKTKQYLQPNVVYRSYIGKESSKENRSGKYNRAEEIMAQLMDKTTPREKVNFESQYRVVQDNAVYELVEKGLGQRDAVAKEEPVLVMGKYKDKSGAEHNIFATLNPIVHCYDTPKQVEEYNHFAERAKLPSVEPVSCRHFKKDENGEVIYKVSIGTPLTGEHEYHEVPRSRIPDVVSEKTVERVRQEADKRDGAA